MALLEKVVSGGQTGVDRAGLDAAMAAGILVGGWCPRGKLAEDRRIPDRYPLQETPRRLYAQRTEWNVRDSDATLILNVGPELTGGTATTADAVARLGKPVLVVDLDRPPEPAAVRSWLAACGARVLNVAGPRESKARGVHVRAEAFLAALFAG